MKPKLHEYTSRAGDIDEIISSICSLDCSQFFKAHLGKPQLEQKKIVSNFQTAIYKVLSNNITNISWQLEYSPNTGKGDSIDIFGSNNEIQVVIELDKHRADQVAKKFVSRNALLLNAPLIDKPIFYISLCYPGTEAMNLNECIKYFSYCKQLSKRMGNEYAGFIIK